MASRPPLIAWGFGHKGAKTYVLQQDDGDSDMRGRDEAVNSHGAHMACVNQAVTHAITTQCCMHIHCVQVACSVWTCEVTLVASLPPLIARGFGHKGAKTYVLQQDGGDSDMRSGDEAVHSRGAHMDDGVCHLNCHTCHHHAVLHAHALRAGHVQCLDLRGDFLVASHPPLA